MYKKILVAYNGTPESLSALHECIHMNPPPSTEVHLLAVVQLSPHGMAGGYAPEIAFTTEREMMEQELERGRTLMAAAGLNVVPHLQLGEPVEVIGALADVLGIDLIIVGHSRHKALAMRWWRGSMDALLIERVKASILVAVRC
ncbi:Nucleotide-binding universal stress protein, UspA family [Collimonas sp. OK307]|uniref:universal stress protein n=1 Tax=Collimonas sp. OK307 TaxID=1801620 RepID=UPI0008E11801|nr:universal stress protein [Collimonas sp. OK307]SFH63236.1 Nucleotide-binding universal stress protein, UspA family [Collimonas sp. OK307]